jgi:hypothetical protein
MEFWDGGSGKILTRNSRVVEKLENQCFWHIYRLVPNSHKKQVFEAKFEGYLILKKPPPTFKVHFEKAEKVDFCLGKDTILTIGITTNFD